MTIEEKKLEELLLKHIDNQVSCLPPGTDTVPDSAYALIALWKYVDESETPIFEGEISSFINSGGEIEIKGKIVPPLKRNQSGWIDKIAKQIWKERGTNAT